MFKIGPKIHSNNCCSGESCSCHTKHVHQNCSCCCCHEEPIADKFEKAKVDKVSLKKVLPLGAVAGLASAALVVAASNIISKAAKPFTSAIAAGIGIGVATGVINGTLANAASKQSSQEQKEIIA